MSKDQVLCWLLWISMVNVLCLRCVATQGRLPAGGCVWVRVSSPGVEQEGHPFHAIHIPSSKTNSLRMHSEGHTTERGDEEGGEGEHCTPVWSGGGCVRVVEWKLKLKGAGGGG
eukprot:Sspe_Gene.10985::Locus_3703_Transcript_1_1_Confidence_1.000_Length_368::g.10985::m.10985